MTRRSLVNYSLICLVVLVAILAVAGTVVGQSDDELTRGEPALDAHLPDGEIIAGAEDTGTIELHNEGDLIEGTQRDRVTTARGVSVEVVDEGPFDIGEGTNSMASISEDSTHSFEKRIAAPIDLEPGEYEITVEADYGHTYQVSDSSTSTQERTGSEEFDLTITVLDEAAFEVTDVKSDVEPGGDGIATLEVENVGTAAASDTRANVTGSGGVAVDGDQTSVALGDLEAGERTTFDVDVEIAEVVADSEKPLAVDFYYNNEDGLSREAVRTETARLAPASSSSFSVENVESSLTVGHKGELTGELRNDGDRPVEGGLLVAKPDSETLFFEDSQYALPDLEPGESTTFEYPVEVSGQAEPGSRQLEFIVEYGGGDRSTITSSAMHERVEVGGERDEFALGDEEITVDQGDTTEFDLEITNQREETLSSIDASLYTDSPLDSDNDEAFVDELEPGESAELRFDVTADSDATVESHPFELDFEYDTARGEAVISDIYQYPVTVEEDDDSSLGLFGWALPMIVGSAGGGLIGGSSPGVVGLSGIVLILGGGVLLGSRVRSGERFEELAGRVDRLRH